MCFSANVSFCAGAFLSIIGLVGLFKAPKKYLLFAAIPLLFAIQQISEGFLWRLSTTDPSNPLRQIMIYTFLFFAFVVWPTWIPLSTYIFETNKKRKTILKYLLILGIAVSTLLLIGIALKGATASAIGCHIVYTIPNWIPAPPLIALVVYATTVLTPFFVVSLPGASFIGLLIGLSCIIAWFIWCAAFTSIWCFFAALLSVFILFYLPNKQCLI
jgi:hypothetical protein